VTGHDLGREVDVDLALAAWLLGLTRLVSQAVRLLVISVGRLRAPYVDDVAHYAKLLGRYARLEQIELRDGERVAGRGSASATTSRCSQATAVRTRARHSPASSSSGARRGATWRS
jgi:hypothetical protein